MASDDDNFVGDHAGMSSHMLTAPTKRMTLPRDPTTGSTPKSGPSRLNKTASHRNHIHSPLFSHTQQAAGLRIVPGARVDSPAACATGTTTLGTTMQQSQNPESNASGGVSELLKPFKDLGNLHKKQASIIFKDLVIPDEILERFKCFKQQIEPELAKRLRAESSKPNVLWEMYMVGTSEQDAEPTSVFHSNKKLAKRIDAFFKQKHLQNTMKESNTDFPVHYTLQPPRLLYGDARKVSIWTPYGRNHSLKTLCGLPVISENRSASARATIGGILLVDGTLFGMTVDHHISQLVSVYDESSEVDATPLTDSSSDSSGSSDPEIFDPSGFRNIASANMRDFESRESFSYLDWALIQLPHDLLLPNVMITSMMSWAKEIPSQQFLDIDAINIESRQSVREVVLISGNHHLKPAALRPHSASLLMNPGTEFTEVLTLSLKKGYELQKGDSGSWVVDQSQGRLYGHLVAGTADGDGLIVPIQATFEDMKEVTKASSIRLPSAEQMRRMSDRMAAGPSGFTDRMAAGPSGFSDTQSASNTTSINTRSIDNIWLASRNLISERLSMMRPELNVPGAARSVTLPGPHERINHTLSEVPVNEDAGVKSDASEAQVMDFVGSQHPEGSSSQSISYGVYNTFSSSILPNQNLQSPMMARFLTETEGPWPGGRLESDSRSTEHPRQRRKKKRQ